MREPGQSGAVLRPALPGAVGVAARRRQDRRNLILGIAAAVFFHLAIVGSFWLIDRLRIRDIGEWSGPILVKIGTSGAPDLPIPDPGPLPEESATPSPETPVTQPDAAESTESPSISGTAAVAEKPTPAQTPQPQPSAAAKNTNVAQTSPAAAQPAKPAPAPQPSRVLGKEQGNSYEMNFNGTEDEVGRVGAYEGIIRYMPLPNTLDAAMVHGAMGSKVRSPETIRAAIEMYWELKGGVYEKRRDPPMDIRPEYWSLLTNELGYNLADADWRTADMRPVIVEFTVGLSDGTSGAALSNFVMKTRTNDPKVDEAVLYGLNRWVYYNKTDQPIKGRITYNFDR